MSVLVGTSGWHYKHWLGGVFYPPGLRPEELLSYYARQFPAVEINSSFYRLPPEETLATWRDSTPPDFVFAYKASRYLTHRKKLRDSEEPLERLLAGTQVLGRKLGPILFQLPPQWHLNRERLEEFLGLLPRGLRAAFEFRDPTWFEAGVYDLLKEHEAAFCIYDLAGRRSPDEVTADFVYLRMHGPEGAYEGSYSKKQLSELAASIREWERQRKDVYCFFDNDQQGFAAANARDLRDLLGGLDMENGKLR